MQKAIIGKKIGMTQIFDEKGRVVPVTVVEAGPCVVTTKKTVENDGYASVQLGYGDLKPHKVNKPMKGFFDKNGVAPKDVFTPGDKIDVTGKSKGKGTAGVIKRWNFHRLKESHGTGPCVRHGGSIGACSSPSRVWKGKKMAGHLGSEQVTVQNLTVVKVDVENNLIAVKGAVPGPNKGIVVLKDSVKA